MGAPAPLTAKFYRAWMAGLVKRSPADRPALVRIARNAMRQYRDDGNEVARMIVSIKELTGRRPRWPNGSPAPTWPTLRAEMHMLGIRIPASV